MGARGPAPKPTALRIIEGNPGKKPLSHDEPKPTLGIPPCPAWLEPEAKKEWRRVSRELDRIGMLTLVDGTALAGYCESYARWRQAERILTEQGKLTYETDTGYVRERPEVGIAQRYLGLVKQFAAEFGLTPSSRTRIRVPDKGNDEEASPFDF